MEENETYYELQSSYDVFTEVFAIIKIKLLIFREELELVRSDFIQNKIIRLSRGFQISFSFEL